MVTNSGKIALGAWGEKIAAEFLREQGYQVITTNFRCGYGEIDLICKEDATWCFVEVKTRRNSKYGLGYEAVTITKQKHMLNSASHYLAQMELFEVPVRFDVVSIDFTTDGQYQIKLIKNAFSN